MVDTPLRLTPEDAQHPWWPYTNPLVRLLRGVNTGGVILRGDLGTRRDLTNPNTETTGNYTLDVQSKATGGLHAAFVLSGTSATAAPTAVNSAVLIQDSGLILGTTARLDLETIRIYESGRVDYSELTSLNGELLLGGSGASAGGAVIGAGKALRILEASGGDYASLTSSNGELNLGGSGASAGGLSLGAALRVLSGNAVQVFNAANTAAGQFAANAAGDIVVAGTTSNLIVNGNPSWLSGTSFAITLDHAATAARTVTFQDLTGTVALLGVANAGGNLIFTDNTYDLGTNGTTARPRTLYLGTSLNVSNGAQLLTATDVTLTAPYTDWSNVIGLTQNGARTFTVDYAYYRIFGKFVHVMACVTCTNAGTAGNTIQITGVPAAIAPANQGYGYPLGTFVFWDQSTAFYHGYAVALSATTIEGISYGATNTMGINAPAPALANTDKIGIDLMYRLA